MATIHFTDGESAEHDRVFVAENGWVAVTGPESEPAMYPPHRVRKVEGDHDIFYDTAVVQTEVGSRHVDDAGRPVQEPDIVRRLVTEVEVD
ncbi:MAG: hypothetical protein ABEJ68_11110 [Halobacteriaceae archaeon]